jgi:muramoyltetrapeptide carboxypeptidase LdcA involved in peptidoglycan recycling
MSLMEDVKATQSQERIEILREVIFIVKVKRIFTIRGGFIYSIVNGRHT